MLVDLEFFRTLANFQEAPMKKMVIAISTTDMDRA